MARRIPFLLLLTTFGACAQPDPTEMKNENPLLCDIETGTCDVAGATTQEAVNDAPVVATAGNTVTIQYFTDPICSSCWGIEPQLRRLAVEYGSAVEVEYHMGGLLPGWDGFNGGGISKPSDVATHWNEMSQHYKMPIIGDVWLEDSLASSYPPSIAFKAAELQDKQMAHAFMRRMREMVFMEKRNIARQGVINEAAAQVGLDSVRLESDMKGAGDALFKADLALTRASGVRGFPTIDPDQRGRPAAGGVRCPLLRADGGGAEAARAGRLRCRTPQHGGCALHPPPQLVRAGSRPDAEHRTSGSHAPA